MPILLLVILIVLIAQIGFWDTLQAILGAAAMLVLALVLVGALIGLGAWWAVRRFRRSL